MCFLHQAKSICSNYELYLKEVQKLRLMFNNNGYSNSFIDNTHKKFEEQSAAKNNSQKTEKDFFFTISLPYFGIHANLLDKTKFASSYSLDKSTFPRNNF